MSTTEWRSHRAVDQLLGRSLPARHKGWQVSDKKGKTVFRSGSLDELIGTGVTG